MSGRDIQLDSSGRLRHFLTIEGLGRELLTEILDTAESFAGVAQQSVKKVPLLRGKTIVNLFFEASTRTRTTFELAAKRLSADVLNLNIPVSSTSKGESLVDTLRTLEAMHCDMFVVRHSDSGAAHFIAQHAAPHVSVINAGDGRHAHPTQAMLDAFTLRRHKGDFKHVRVAIVGDILHSRVARSEIHALNTLGVAEVRVVAPKTLLPANIESMGVHVFHDLRTGLKDVDVVMMLRLQRERMQGALLPSEREYFHLYGLTPEKLAIAKPDVIVMHPGPINRGVEISSTVADGSHSVILQQVSHGVAIRMAVMSMAMQRDSGMRPERQTSIVIHRGRVIDPANGIDAVQDLYLAQGRIAALANAPEGFVADQVIDAHGCIVCPGLVDLQARLREPGQEHKATIASETHAAVRGGITTLCCPPDTDPVIDTPAVVELIHRRAEEAALTKIAVLGALTQGLQGTHLSEMGALKEAGCAGVSNGLQPVTNTLVLRRALEYAATHDLTVFLHANDPWLGQGCAHEGIVSTRLGLPGIPEAAETVIVARDLVLIEQTGVRAHFCQLSATRSLEMVRQARAQGLPVSADVTAHHLHLTEADLLGFNNHCHVLPPLRTARDREALRGALKDGLLCAVCSDHQPHEPDAKQAPFCNTEPGISALETLLPLTLRLVEQDLLILPEAIARLTWMPAHALGIEAGSLGVGKPADICIFDPLGRWHLTEEALVSRGHNTPFLGWELTGSVTHTLVGGRVVYARER